MISLQSWGVSGILDHDGRKDLGQTQRLHAVVAIAN
jgi:hypothetical protein